MNFVKELERRHHRRLSILFTSLVIGVLAGGVVTLYRALIPLIGRHVKAFYIWGAASWGRSILVVLAMAAAGLAVGLFVQREPMIGGSGIPQVAGQLRGYFNLCWWRVLFYKFVGGLLTLGGGLTLGREGPSVQIGASIGDGFSRLTHRSETDRRLLTASGSAAGLSAAFSAPISGLVFALEEVHRNFSPIALVSAMTAALSANVVGVFIFGVKPVLSLPELPAMKLGIYWLLLLLGIFTGLSGVLFNYLIMKGKKWYAALRLPLWAKPVIPYVATAVFVLLRADLFGSGESFIFLPLGENPAPGTLILLYAIKLFLLVIAFCSGMPGGIFFPLLILGSLTGNVFGSLSASLGLIEPEWVLIFAVIAMSAHFASIVRAPLTGLLLIVEMTGSFTYLLPLGLVTLVAYLTAEFCRSEPIYEALLDFMLTRRRDRERQAAEEPDGADMMVEFPVCMFSPADGHRIRDLDWPDDFLFVAIRRGEKELLPKGHVVLRAGDSLVAMLNRRSIDRVETAIAKLTEAPPHAGDEVE